ncbi:hypothetical protein ACLOJK_038282 [Asimina triloba]
MKIQGLLHGKLLVTGKSIRAAGKALPCLASLPPPSNIRPGQRAVELSLRPASRPPLSVGPSRGAIDHPLPVPGPLRIVDQSPKLGIGSCQGPVEPPR